MAMQAAFGFSKIIVIVGAGYTGTILLKNGKLSELIGEIQGLVKKWEHQGDQSDGDTDYAEAVRRLASEVKTLAAGAGKQITVLNGSGQNGNFSSLVVPAAALGAVGYGYMCWKGFSFSDLTYVTKHNMEKGVSELTKKLQHASETIDVSGVRETITGCHEDLGFLQQTVETLDERLSILSRKQQEQPKLVGKSSPGLLTYSGTPNLKGLKDITETLSVGLDRSASDANLPDGMDMPRQQPKPLLRAASTRR